MGVDFPVSFPLLTVGQAFSCCVWLCHSDWFSSGGIEADEEALSLWYRLCTEVMGLVFTQSDTEKSRKKKTETNVKCVKEICHVFLFLIFFF